MAKATVHPNAPIETPSQTIVKDANQIQIATDTAGRKIGVKKMSALDRLRMFEAVGSDNVKNEMYLGYASLAFHVIAIDGEPIARPVTKLQLEALIQRLDDHGLTAIGETIAEHFVPTQTDPVETIKNG